MVEQDVPSPIDFHDPEQAARWVSDTVSRRPWRPAFFAAFAASLNSRFTTPFTVLELGSGPGHLAEHLLANCDISNYTLLDFAAPMHAMASDRLAPFDDKTCFELRDFKAPDWTDGLDKFNAIVSMQAVHEIRHKRHIPWLYTQIDGLLTPGGWFLVSDHYVGGQTSRNTSLYMTKNLQKGTLKNAGFDHVTLLLDEGEMTLFAAQRPEIV